MIIQRFGQSQMTKIRNRDNRIVSSNPEIPIEIMKFCGNYMLTEHAPAPTVHDDNDPRAALTRHYTDDIPDVSLGEIEISLGHLKNGKGFSADGITTEFLKTVGFRS
ncbi:hypothetical protein EVAR_46246_1 [Eumeta japonica]|uniref:Uncharacterized protein n=1 Tax=Eumeta variegata TaxID=151549 RepID=A0A4C1Y5E0_EUMVA|nr:hypothetical protein EVAR_46246_1 [Eumeta japonica]